MPGGHPEAWPLIKPIFQAICAKADGEPCCEWVGEGGAGHFVKMVHNGIGEFNIYYKFMTKSHNSETKQYIFLISIKKHIYIFCSSIRLHPVFCAQLFMP